PELIARVPVWPLAAPDRPRFFSRRLHPPLFLFLVPASGIARILTTRGEAFQTASPDEEEQGYEGETSCSDWWGLSDTSRGAGHRSGRAQQNGGRPRQGRRPGSQVRSGSDVAQAARS